MSNYKFLLILSAAGIANLVNLHRMIKVPPETVERIKQINEDTAEFIRRQREINAENEAFLAESEAFLERFRN